MAWAAYRIRSEPLPVVVAMVPLLALALFLITANPTKPNSLSIRFLKLTGFYTHVQNAYASSLGGATKGMVVRSIVVIAMIFWLVGVMKFWP